MVEAEAVADYFAERFGEAVTISSLKQTFPGMSRETWIVGAEVGEGAAKRRRDLVLRIDLPSGGIVPLPLKTEWEVYVRLWPSPVPVAEPLWYDEGLAFAEGRPHMVRELVDGATSIPDLMEPGPEGTPCAAAWRSSTPRSWPWCTRWTGNSTGSTKCWPRPNLRQTRSGRTSRCGRRSGSSALRAVPGDHRRPLLA